MHVRDMAWVESDMTIMLSRGYDINDIIKVNTRGMSGVKLMGVTPDVCQSSNISCIVGKKKR